MVRWPALRLTLLLVVSVCLFLGFTSTSPQEALAQTNGSDKAREVLALVNEWRLQEGLWPLKLNTTLQAMAFSQAQYVANALSEDPEFEDYHHDGQKRSPQARAVQSPYNWPTYGSIKERIEIGENAGVGSPQFAVNYWKNSAIHRRAALSETYREAGVAAIPFQSSYVIIIVFGSRPNVFPAQMSPARDVLYLSQERSPYAAKTTDQMLVRAFDSSGQSITTKLVWQPKIFPSGGQFFPDDLYVLVSQGSFEQISHLTAEQDTVVLPQQSAVVSVVTPTSTPIPVTPPPTVPTAVASAPTATPTATSVDVQPTLTPTATDVAGAPKLANPDIILYYDKNGLTLLVTAAKAVNVTALVIQGSNGRVSVDGWLKVASFPASALTKGNCLQAHVTGARAIQDVGCKFVRSQVEVASTRIFGRLIPSP